MELPNENPWTDPRQRLSFQTIFSSLDPSFLLNIPDIEMRQAIDNAEDMSNDDENGTKGFPDDRGRPRGPDAPRHVYMDMPKITAERHRSWRLRLTPTMRRLQIRRVMRLEHETQSQRSLEQLQFDSEPQDVVCGNHLVQRGRESTEKLPVEVLLHIISHTNIEAIPKLERSLTRFGDMLRAIPRASIQASILRVQYPHWVKAFGGPGARTERQKSYLLQAMASISYGAWVIVARSKDVEVDKLITKTRGRVLSDEYCLAEYLVLLSHLESKLDHTARILTACCKSGVTTEAAVCIERCTYRHWDIGGVGHDQHMMTKDLTWGERKRIIQEQDEGVRLEVGRILESAVSQVVTRLDFLGPSTVHNILEAYPPRCIEVHSEDIRLEIALRATVLVLDCIFKHERGIALINQSTGRQDFQSIVEDAEQRRLEEDIRLKWSQWVKAPLAPGNTKWRASAHESGSYVILAIELDLMGVLAGSCLEAAITAKQQQDGGY